MELDELDVSTAPNPDRPFVKKMPFSAHLRRMSMGALPELPADFADNRERSPAAEVEDDPEFALSSDVPSHAAEFLQDDKSRPSTTKVQLQVPSGVKSLNINLSTHSLHSASDTRRGDISNSFNTSASASVSPLMGPSRIGSPAQSVVADDVTPQSFIALSRKRRPTPALSSSNNLETSRRLKQAEDKMTTLLGCLSVQELLIGGQRTLIARLRDIFNQHGTASARAHTEQLGLALLASCEERDRLQTEHGLLLDLSQHYYEMSVEQHRTIEELKAALGRTEDARAELVRAHEQERAQWRADADAREEQAMADIDAALMREENTNTASTAIIQRLQAAVQMLSDENERLTRQLRQPQLALGLLAQTPVLLGSTGAQVGSAMGSASGMAGTASGSATGRGQPRDGDGERLAALRTLAAIERGAFNAGAEHQRGGEASAEPAWRQYGNRRSAEPRSRGSSASARDERSVAEAGARVGAPAGLGAGVGNARVARAGSKSRNHSPGSAFSARATASIPAERSPNTLPPLLPGGPVPATPTAGVMAGTGPLPALVAASYKDTACGAPIAVRLPHSQTRVFVPKVAAVPRSDTANAHDPADVPPAAGEEWANAARTSLLSQAHGVSLPEDRNLGPQYQGGGDSTARLRKYVSALPATRALGGDGYAVVTKAVRKVMEAAQMKRASEEKRAQELAQKVVVGKEDVDALLRIRSGRESPPFTRGESSASSFQENRREHGSLQRGVRKLASFTPSESPFTGNTPIASPRAGIYTPIVTSSVRVDDIGNSRPPSRAHSAFARLELTSSTPIKEPDIT